LIYRAIGIAIIEGRATLVESFLEHVVEHALEQRIEQMEQLTGAIVVTLRAWVIDRKSSTSPDPTKIKAK
jgi:hypothetical protein